MRDVVVWFSGAALACFLTAGAFLLLARPHPNPLWGWN
jgi:hypothetical protein